MNDALRTLRIRVATAIFLAIQAALVVLLIVSAVSETSTEIEQEGDQFVVNEVQSTRLEPAVIAATIALVPVVGGVAWLIAGWAMRPAAAAARQQEQLIAETSHELRTPLSVLRANADVVLGLDDPSNDDLRHAVIRSREATSRMETTIDGLLTDARLRARGIDRHPVDVAQLSRDIVLELRALAEEASIELVVSAPDAVLARVETEHVSRAIRNLVRNAIVHHDRDGRIDVHVLSVDGEARVTVTDDGPGVPAIEHDAIFERFRRGGDASAEGSGLGLPLARQIAEAHGGTLTVESPIANGRGSRFTLSLGSSLNK